MKNIRHSSPNNRHCENGFCVRALYSCTQCRDELMSKERSRSVPEICNLGI